MQEVLPSARKVIGSMTIEEATVSVWPKLEALVESLPNAMVVRTATKLPAEKHVLSLLQAEEVKKGAGSKKKIDGLWTDMRVHDLQVCPTCAHAEPTTTRPATLPCISSFFHPVVGGLRARAGCGRAAGGLRAGCRWAVGGLWVGCGWAADRSHPTTSPCAQLLHSPPPPLPHTGQDTEHHTNGDLMRYFKVERPDKMNDVEAEQALLKAMEGVVGESPLREMERALPIAMGLVEKKKHRFAKHAFGAGVRVANEIWGEYGSRSFRAWVATCVSAYLRIYLSACLLVCLFVCFVRPFRQSVRPFRPSDTHCSHMDCAAALA
eukprot:SAG11_NODE_6281_length_1344_cov_2.567068_2_plen_321_part_00